jgi:hypothetical protein
VAVSSDPDDLLEQLQRQGVARLWAEQAAKKAAGRGPKLPSTPKRQHPERDLQKQIVGYINRFVQNVVVAAVTNEERGRGDAEQRARFGAMRRASGVLSGFPDLTVWLPNGRVLLWECKSDKGRVSVAQHLVHSRLDALGHPVEIIRSLEDAMAALVRAGVAVPGRALRASTPVEPLSRGEP